MPNGIEIRERRLEDALDLYNRDDEFFLALAREEEWEDEDNLPELSGDSDDVDDFEDRIIGYVKSSVDIDSIQASITIGSGDDGEVEIEVDESYLEGKEGNDVICSVVDTSGDSDLDLNVINNEDDKELIIELGTDSDGDINSTAEEIADEVDSIAEYNADYSGDGSGVFSSDDEIDEENFDGGEGPEKKACFIEEDDDGDILYQGENYKKLYDKDLDDELPNKLYFEILVPTDAFEEVESYRQIGIYYNLERADGVSEDEDVLEESDVDDRGVLYSISNFRRVRRRSDRFETTAIIVEF